MLRQQRRRPEALVLFGISHIADPDMPDIEKMDDGGDDALAGEFTGLEISRNAPPDGRQALPEFGQQLIFAVGP
jgi:hypothetical protein